MYKSNKYNEFLLKKEEEKKIKKQKKKEEKKIKKQKQNEEKKQKKEEEKKIKKQKQITYYLLLQILDMSKTNLVP